MTVSFAGESFTKTSCAFPEGHTKWDKIRISCTRGATLGELLAVVNEKLHEMGDGLYVSMIGYTYVKDYRMHYMDTRPSTHSNLERKWLELLEEQCDRQRDISALDSVVITAGNACHNDMFMVISNVVNEAYIRRRCQQFPRHTGYNPRFPTSTIFNDDDCHCTLPTFVVKIAD